jgi:hypothetical protein
MVDRWDLTRQANEVMEGSQGQPGNQVNLQIMSHQMLFEVSFCLISIMSNWCDMSGRLAYQPRTSGFSRRGRTRKHVMQFSPSAGSMLLG